MKFTMVISALALLAAASTVIAADVVPVVRRSSEASIAVRAQRSGAESVSVLAERADVEKRSTKCKSQHRRHHKSKKSKKSKKPSRASSSFGGGKSGSATFFTQDGTEGACGRGKVPDSAKVVAMCPQLFRSMCGKTIKIHNTVTGKTIDAVGNDECPSCSCDHLDLSLGAYDALGQSRDVGVLKIEFAL